MQDSKQTLRFERRPAIRSQHLQNQYQRAPAVDWTNFAKAIDKMEPNKHQTLPIRTHQSEDIKTEDRKSNNDHDRVERLRKLGLSQDEITQILQASNNGEPRKHVNQKDPKTISKSRIDFNQHKDETNKNNNIALSKTVSLTGIKYVHQDNDVDQSKEIQRIKRLKKMGLLQSEINQISIMKVTNQNQDSIHALSISKTHSSKASMSAPDDPKNDINETTIKQAAKDADFEEFFIDLLKTAS